MKTFEIVLESEHTGEQRTVTESGWDAEDMLDTLSTKYGDGYIIVKVTPSKYSLSESVD